MYKTAIVHWSIQPSEFWAMTPAEFWHIFELRHGKSSVRYGTLREDEVDELYNLLKEAKK